MEEEIVPKAGSSEPMLAGQERLPRGNKDLTETCRMNWSQPGEEWAKHVLSPERSIK